MDKKTFRQRTVVVCCPRPVSLCHLGTPLILGTDGPERFLYAYALTPEALSDYSPAVSRVTQYHLSSRHGETPAM